MMKYVTVAVLLVAVSARVDAMNVQTFLTKAEALERTGPLALFSSDLKLLMNQVQSDMTALKVEKDADEAAKRRLAFCPPDDSKVSLSDKDILEAMRAVPPARRSSTDSRDALRAFFGRRYPCPR